MRKESIGFNENTIVAEGLEKYPHLERYDQALKMLISQVFAGDVVVTPDNMVKEYAIKQTEDNVKYPIISLWPSNVYSVNNNNSFPQYQMGIIQDKFVDVRDEDTNTSKGRSSFVSKNVQHLYIDIDYQVDVWALSRSEGLQVVQELLFWLYNQQEVKVKYYGKEFILSLVPPETFTDNSDLSQADSEGKIYNYTLDLQVHATIFRSKNWFNAIDRVISLDVSDSDAKED